VRLSKLTFSLHMNAYFPSEEMGMEDTLFVVCELAHCIEMNDDDLF